MAGRIVTQPCANLLWSIITLVNFDIISSLVLNQMEGVCGFKCFLTHSGVDEFPCVNRAEVEAALAELKVCPAFDYTNYLNIIGTF